MKNIAKILRKECTGMFRSITTKLRSKFYCCGSKGWLLKSFKHRTFPVSKTDVSLSNLSLYSACEQSEGGITMWQVAKLQPWFLPRSWLIKISLQQFISLWFPSSTADMTSKTPVLSLLHMPLKQWPCLTLPLKDVFINAMQYLPDQQSPMFHAHCLRIEMYIIILIKNIHVKNILI